MFSERLILIFILTVGLSGLIYSIPTEILGRCEAVMDPICSQIYNSTRMPNLINNTNQMEARKVMEMFHPLKVSHCNQYLDIFLCSYLFPKCHNNRIQLPCKEFCNYIKNDCSKYLQYLHNSQNSWSRFFNCDILPAQKSNDCIYISGMDKDADNKKNMGNGGNKNPVEVVHEGPSCLPYQINIAESPNISCKQRCSSNLLFTREDKNFANYWLIIWSSICVLASLLTIVIFSCHSARFRYPEKPIVFLSICYFFYSSGCLMSILLGRQIVTCKIFSNLNDAFIVSHGNEPTWCKINFLMTYFFGSASSLWWVMLTVTWYLSANRQWGNEAIESLSSLLHLISWGIPAIKSIIIMILQKIDTDELTGQCFVGNESLSSLLGFIVVPQLFYLVIGIIFLTLGYSSLLKVRKSFMNQPDRMDTSSLKKMEKLMAKIAVFSVLYIVPAFCVIGSYIMDATKINYIHKIMDAVYRQKTFSKCLTTTGLLWQDHQCTALLEAHLPSVEIRMLRIFMNLVIGITSGVWIWGNLKSFKSLCTPPSVSCCKSQSKLPEKSTFSAVSYPQSNQQTHRLLPVPSPPAPSSVSPTSYTTPTLGVYPTNTSFINNFPPSPTNDFNGVRRN